jgi:hypothetical protein
MADLLLFVLAAVGMTHIVVDGTIFDPVRTWAEKPIKWTIPFKRFFDWVKTKLSNIMGCHQCCGFWCGVVVALIFLTYNPLMLLLYGCASSIMSMWARGYLDSLEAQTVLLTEDLDEH